MHLALSEIVGYLLSLVLVGGLAWDWWRHPTR
jgi:hypothetical protein